MAHGELFVTGRLKDMIIRGGQHFFPYELEEAIGKLAGVVQGGVAVCGGSSATGATERLVIFAETRLPDGPQRHVLEARINAKTIALFGSPAEQIALVPPNSILRTPGGKIRHAATLQAFTSNGGVLAGRSAWRQLLALTVDSARPLGQRVFKRGVRVGRGVACGIAVVALGSWLIAASVSDRDPASNWRRATRASRLFLKLAGIDVEFAGETQALDLPGAVLVCNHTSYLDVVVLASVMPAPIRFVAKHELERQWLVGRLVRRLGTCFVERDNFSSSVVDEELVHLAVQGERLLYFPEGSFTRAAGLRAFHLGAFRAACLAARAVVPIALDGTRVLLPDGNWIPARGRVTVTACAPLAPDASDLAAMARLRDKTRASILAHCSEGDAADLGFVSTTNTSSARSAQKSA